MATLDGGWSDAWYEYKFSILFGKAKKLPNAPSTYVSLSPADVPKSFLADDGTVRHETRTRVSFAPAIAATRTLIAL